MSPSARPYAYFAAAFFPAFAASAQSAHTPKDWVLAFFQASAAGFAAVIAYFDNTDHNDHTPPPAVPA